ncbi:hypothetical protein HYR54_07210 [Candidatus Acetothermia bacterium]|nr:hypothetical protein [Candidatus Acetothermia bacterium]
MFTKNCARAVQDYLIHWMSWMLTLSVLFVAINLASVEAKAQSGWPPTPCPTCMNLSIETVSQNDGHLVGLMNLFLDQIASLFRAIDQLAVESVRLVFDRGHVFKTISRTISISRIRDQGQ